MATAAWLSEYTVIRLAMIGAQHVRAGSSARTSFMLICLSAVPVQSVWYMHPSKNHWHQWNRRLSSGTGDYDNLAWALTPGRSPRTRSTTLGQLACPEIYGSCVWAPAAGWSCQSSAEGEGSPLGSPGRPRIACRWVFEVLASWQRWRCIRHAPGIKGRVVCPVVSEAVLVAHQSLCLGRWSPVMALVGFCNLLWTPEVARCAAGNSMYHAIPGRSLTPPKSRWGNKPGHGSLVIFHFFPSQVSCV